jgi:hypothetical protein
MMRRRAKDLGRLSENAFLSFRTERSEVRNLEKSRYYHEQDFSLALEMTILGQPPGATPGKCLEDDHA